VAEESAQRTKVFVARDLASQSIPVVEDTISLSELAKVLGASPHLAAVITTKDQVFGGMVTSSDLLKVLGSTADHTAKIKDALVANPLSIESRKPIQVCLELMLKRRVHYLPVVDNGVYGGTILPLDAKKFLLSTINDKIVELQEAERKIDYRDEFISILAHDIRSPLNLINGCVVIINEMENTEPVLLPEYKSLVAQVQESALRSLNLVTDLLDIGRLNAGMKMNFQAIEVKKYMHDVSSPLRTLAARENIELVTEFDDGIEAIIDPDRTQQIIDNLVNNAIKVSSGGKRIFLKTELDDRLPEKARLKISVRDEGPGIPAEKLGVIFQKYRQLDGIGKSRGVGLGLSIVAQYARLQSGEIDVIGGEGSGATFVVYLPNARRLSVPDVPKVLIVDDDQQILDLILEDMAASPYDLRVAHDGVEALSVLKTFVPSVVVTDMAMPNMDGIAFIGEVRKIYPKVPIVILSGHTNFLRVANLAEHLKVEYFISKPFTSEELASTLDRILVNKRGA